eukprot:6185548-Pleurochrysis_carterae.AAC.1
MFTQTPPSGGSQPQAACGPPLLKASPVGIISPHKKHNSHILLSRSIAVWPCGGSILESEKHLQLERRHQECNAARSALNSSTVAVAGPQW